MEHTYPRLVSYAETGWTPLELKDWNSFQQRLPDFLERLKRMGARFNPKTAFEFTGKN